MEPLTMPAARPQSISWAAFGELLRFRSLLWALTWRDIRVRYAQTLLGIAWAVAAPLAMMAVFTFVFTKAVKVADGFQIPVPYPLFVYAGLVPWTFLSSSLNGSIQSLTANRSLVTKVYFPREVLPGACVLGALVDFCIGMVVLIGLMIYFASQGSFDLPLTRSWLFVPVVALTQTLLTVGLGLVLSAAHLFHRDVRPLFAVVIQVWMFLSGVVVPVPTEGSTAAELLSLNPMLHLISAYRSCLLLGRLPDGTEFAGVCAAAVIVALIGWIVFRRASRRFAECI
jgi:ABC-type polysaccharide/polyol phosphate export permease